MLYIHVCFIRLINQNLNRELWIIYDLLNLIDDLTRISARFLTKTCLLFLLNLLFNFVVVVVVVDFVVAHCRQVKVRDTL